MKLFPTLLTLLLMLAAASSHGEDYMHLPMVEKVIQSDYIALATLVEDRTEGWPATLRFSISVWLKKKDDLPTDTVEVNGFSIYGLKPFLQKKEGRFENNIEQFLLFFSKWDYDNELSFGLISTGVLAQSKNGQFLSCFQTENPGPYHMFAFNKNRPGADTTINFANKISEAKIAIIKTDSVFALFEKHDVKERNKAIFAWVQKYMRELQQQGFMEAPWGSLKEKAFEKLWHSGDDRAAWEALLLWQKMDTLELANPNITNDQNSEFPFGTPAIRDFFYELIKKQKSSLLEKKLAVYYLTESLWSNLTVQADQLPKHPIRRSEQDKYADLFYSLARHNDLQMRQYAIAALAKLLKPKYGYEILTYRNERINKMLMKLYPTIPAGYWRKNFVEMLHAVLSGDEWESLTGNPYKMLVLVSNFHYDPAKKTISYQFEYKHGRGAISAPPKLIAKKLNKKGKVLEKFVFPINKCRGDLDWEKGLYVDFSDRFCLPADELSEGLWRFQMEGVVSNMEQLKWTSEPWELEIGN